MLYIMGLGSDRHEGPLAACADTIAFKISSLASQPLNFWIESLVKLPCASGCY